MDHNPTPKRPTNKNKFVTSIATDGALVELLGRYLPNVLRQIKKYDLMEERKDIVQEIALSFLEQAHKTTIHHPEAYLFTITHNIIARFCKRRKQRRSMFLTEEEIGQCQKALADDADLNMELEKRHQQLFEKVLNIIDIHLPLEHSLILKRRYLEGKSFEEIAQEVGKTESNVRQIISRSRRRIRDLLP